MALQQNVDVSKLVRHINVGLRRYGLADRDGNLKTVADSRNDSNVKILQKQIIVEVAMFFNISERRIRTSTERGHVTEARVMCIILLNKHATLTSVELGRLFGRGTRVINQRLSAFKKAQNGKKTIKNYGDSLFLHKFNKINARIVEFKKTMK